MKICLSHVLPRSWHTAYPARSWKVLSPSLELDSKTSGPFWREIRLQLGGSVPSYSLPLSDACVCAQSAFFLLPQHGSTAASTKRGGRWSNNTKAKTHKQTGRWSDVDQASRSQLQTQLLDLFQLVAGIIGNIFYASHSVPLTSPVEKLYSALTRGHPAPGNHVRNWRLPDDADLIQHRDVDDAAFIGASDFSVKKVQIKDEPTQCVYVSWTCLYYFTILLLNQLVSGNLKSTSVAYWHIFTYST